MPVGTRNRKRSGTLRVAVIGCGKQGPRHAAAFADCPEVDRVTMADLDPARARAAAAPLGADWYDTVDAVFADDEIRAVVIATPTPGHFALVRRALAAQKHVLCEKPFGDAAAPARDLARLAAAGALVGQVGYLYRVAPAIVAARAAIPALGPIAEAVFSIAAPGGVAAWKHRGADGGGAANELMAHMFDLALWFFGPARVCAILEKSLTAPCRTIAGARQQVDAEDRVLARLAMSSGMEVTVRADFVAQRFAQSLEIRGRNGVVRASIHPGFPSAIELKEAAGGLAAGLHPLPRSAPGALYRFQAEAFLAAIAGEASPGAAGFAEAAAVSALLAEVRAAPITAAPRSRDLSYVAR